MYFTFYSCYSVLAASHKIKGRYKGRKLMLKTGNSLTPDILIQKDKMRLAVTNIYPSFHKKTEHEARQEISAKLYQVFSKKGQINV